MLYFYFPLIAEIFYFLPSLTYSSFNRKLFDIYEFTHLREVLLVFCFFYWGSVPVLFKKNVYNLCLFHLDPLLYLWVLTFCLLSADFFFLQGFPLGFLTGILSFSVSLQIPTTGQNAVINQLWSVCLWWICEQYQPYT